MDHKPKWLEATETLPRLIELHETLDSWAKPLGDLDALRHVVAELLRVLIEEKSK